MSDVTRLLHAIDVGDQSAASQLLPLVYDELRKLAAQKMACERAEHTLDATALVHEAWIRLSVSPGSPQSTASKSEFFRAAAVAMQRVLVDHARAKKAEKRGGGHVRASLDPDQLVYASPDSDVLAIHEALEQFRTVDSQAAELVTLRYFGGMALPEAAAVLGISTSTADRWWLYAKTWLYQKLRPS